MSLQIAKPSTIIASFIAVVLIWSTTPLAIKWSGEGPGFMFGIAARMVIGLILLLALTAALRVKLPWHRQALHSYVAAGTGIYGTMMCVYWGAQYIPSGLISVMFGLTPIITGVMAARVLGEDSLTLPKMIGTLLGLLGLIIIFGRGSSLGELGMHGAIVVLLAVIVQSISAVWVKRVHAHLHSVSLTTGSMIIAMPFFVLTWWLLDGHWPAQLPMRAVAAIVYLGAFATVVGFTMYFYIIKHMQASSVGLLNLISPVFALFVGHWLNHEVIDSAVWIGTALILFGMSVYQWVKVRKGVIKLT